MCGPQNTTGAAGVRERAARTLTALTRTLRELNELLSEQPQTGRLCDCDVPEDIDEFRNELARRIEAFVASQPDDECAQTE